MTTRLPAGSVIEVAGRTDIVAAVVWVPSAEHVPVQVGPTVITIVLPPAVKETAEFGWSYDTLFVVT